MKPLPTQKQCHKPVGYFQQQHSESGGFTTNHHLQLGHSRLENSAHRQTSIDVFGLAYGADSDDTDALEYEATGVNMNSATASIDDDMDGGSASADEGINSEAVLDAADVNDSEALAGRDEERGATPGDARTNSVRIPVDAANASARDVQDPNSDSVLDYGSCSGGEGPLDAGSQVQTAEPIYASVGYFERRRKLRNLFTDGMSLSTNRKQDICRYFA